VGLVFRADPLTCRRRPCTRSYACQSREVGYRPAFAGKVPGVPIAMAGALRSQTASNELLAERGQLFLNDLPNDVEVHAEVAVDHTVTRRRDLFPGNLRV